MNFISELIFGKTQSVQPGDLRSLGKIDDHGGRNTSWKVGNTKMMALVDDKNKIISNINSHTLAEDHPTLAALKSCNLVTTKHGTFLVGFETGGVFDQPNEIKVV